MQAITLTSDDGKSVTVNSSPNTSRRIELNEEFREQVFKDKLRVDEETDFEPITEIGEENSPQPPTCEEYQGYRSKAVWLETDCLLLISNYKDLYPDLGKKQALKTKQKMWTLISQRMSAQGLSFSPCQIERKWKSFERAYKNMLKHNRQTGNDRKTCAFQKELSEVLVNRPSVVPTYLLGSTLDSSVSRGEILAQLELGEDSRPPGTADIDELPLEDSLLLEAPQPKKKKERSQLLVRCASGGNSLLKKINIRENIEKTNWKLTKKGQKSFAKVETKGNKFWICMRGLSQNKNLEM